MIDRYHLRYFLAVIDQGNLSKAATACNVSQPTLSVGISKMEKSLGRKLFHRTNRRVELTEAGAQLAIYARRIEADFAEAEHRVVGSTSADTLRLGVLTTIPSRWIETFLSAHRMSGAPQRIEIIEGRERELHERLARNRIDAALTIIRAESRDASHEILFSEGYLLAMSKDHPLAHRTSIGAWELVREPMIVRRHCELLPETSRHFTAHGVRPFFPARTMNDDRALGYVAAGLGITVMPDCFTRPDIVRPYLEGFHFTRDIGIIYAPTTDVAALRANPATRTLIKTIEQLRDPLIVN